ncbi:methionine synthase [Reyranella soli]|uniref:5-methyltetrahydropteroyltriglutamate--homocysteine methyltransferase n=1 Tax=Reyranella soli TaxID=1230389 RepID=A0A512N7D9_9HYPH|nr:methionine synthase [Reyranella soli]GEP54896.1 5-methyltetrahydropteroyltriglutamate--homocysteine methyltransferase [Reyranella soli]
MKPQVSGGPIRATIVGSLPKPAWLAVPNILQAPWKVPTEDLPEALADATRLSVESQVAAGLDVVTDGEQRRRHYIWGFLDGMAAVDTVNLVLKPTRGQRFREEAPVARLVGEPEWTGPRLVEHLRAVRALTKRPVKVTLPGPMTIVDSLRDEVGRHSTADLAMIFADLLNREAKALADAGAAVVQFDEPCFNIYLDQAREWGVVALERAIAGVGTTTGVHICYGYGGAEVSDWKAANRDWSQYEQSLALVARTDIDQVSVETAAVGVDIGVIELLRGKDVLLGLVDVGKEAVETPEVIARGLRRALDHVAPQRLFACTDCGLVLRSREAAAAKMRALAEGAAIVNRELADG